MVGTHFETRATGRRTSVCAACTTTRSWNTGNWHTRNWHTGNWQPATRGFTLTELLVVITIIAILAGLITGAAVNALGRAKEAAITLELQQMGGALEDFKLAYGAYPPNGMNNGATTIAQNDFVRMFKKAFPRSQEPQDLILALAAVPGVSGGGTYNVVPPRNIDGSSDGGGLTGSEAIFFWLGGFSSDPAYPISGPGGPSFSDADGDQDNTLEGSDEVLENRNLRYEFDLGRLLPRTSNGTFDDSAGNGRFLTYSDPRVNPAGTGNTRRINLWRYAPSGSLVPMAYFDTSRHTPEEYDLDMSGLARQKIYALKQLRQGVDANSATLTNSDIRFVEDKKFQILHAGKDDIWGDQFALFQLNIADNGANAWRSVLLAPAGPFIGDVADTLGNFMGGTLEDKQE